MQSRVITVSVLANYLKNIIDAEALLCNIDIIGEIANWSYSGKNVFFTLKDEGAILNCTLFGYENFIIPKIGDKVIVTGTPKYYVKGGKLNFNVSNIKLFGEGEIYKRFLELKNKLEKEGLFDITHKKPMPEKINRIGVVTSETGAVIHDILNVASRRNSAQDIVLYPIKVQGIGADIEIAKAVKYFSDYENVDAIIVGRGGGSEEDLQNFNSEIVARTIYDCKKFVVSAVGHETDYTICDYVADLRAPTPSAAAELLTKDGGERKTQLLLYMKNIMDLVKHNVSLHSTELSNIYFNLSKNINNIVSKTEQNLELIKIKLNKLDPQSILNLGYAKVEIDNKNIDSIKKVNVNSNVQVYLKDGKFSGVITEVKNGLREKN